MRLLIVEDDTILADSLAVFLRNQNYAVDIFNDGQTALNFADFNKYDLLISDYLMPGLNGRELVKEIRKKHRSLPIIMLSAVCESSDKARLLNNGADDYLAKPFAIQELLSRIKVLTRRQHIKPKIILTLSDLTLDIEKGEVKRGTKNINLSSKEISLLKYLMENLGVICSKQDIVGTVWDKEAHHLSNTLEAHIKKLRKKLDFKKPKLIHTRAGRGYKIDLCP